MSKLQELLVKLLSKGITVSGASLNSRGNLCFQVDGFYKSGTVSIYEAENGTLYADARYDETTPLDEFGADPFDNLVRLNCLWWRRSKERYEGWNSPDSAWTEHMVTLGLVEKKVETVVSYS